MAQQTINIGASPNDGTGTPLRTAFQYTNSNFSELYTAVGPSGNNIVVPGSATISGDLTVDTSTLKVDSANDRVGVGTASPASQFHIFNSGATTDTYLEIQNGSASTYIGTRGTTFGAMDAGDSYIFNSSGNDVVLMAANASGAIKFAAGGSTESMRLNATGLGVGTSPSRKLSVSGAGGGLDVTDTTQSTRIRMRSSSASNFYIEALNSAESAYVTLRLNDTTQIDAAGNCGIGVTPSAWVAGAKALQFGAYGALAQSSSGNIELSFNSYNSGAGAYKYLQTDTASLYRASSVHSWFVAPSGTAGNAITFTQAMTLDASGNLFVKKTASGSTTLGVELLATGQINGATANQDNLNIYNTTAAAYRFYVNASGTVFATNTTISAISDARFKENVQDIDVGLGAILALKPRKFDWKDGKGKNIKGDRGFIAQEFETVFPNLIDEWKENAPEGEAPYKSVRQDLIPVLVKAIQELTARVQTLEAK